jgi:tetratricopeptide (TPR) repeat protein
VPQFQIALRDFEDRFPPDYILTANIRREFGGTLIEVGRFREAETLLRAAIQVLAKRWGESDARVDEARVDLGRALSALGRYAEAEEVLAGARNRLEQSRGSEDTLAQRARAAHQALLQVRSRTGG